MAPHRFKPGNIANPKGRPPGPMMPTVILKNALLMAANEAGGGGDSGIVEYLKKVALKHPAAFVGILGKVIPLQIDVKDDKSITVEVVHRFTAQAEVKTIEHAHTNGRGNGQADPTAK